MSDATAKARARLNELIDRGEKILAGKRPGNLGPDYLDIDAYGTWRISAKAVLRSLDTDGLYLKEFEKADDEAVGWGGYPHKLQGTLAALKSFREDFELVGSGGEIKDVEAMPRRPPEPPPIQMPKLSAEAIEVGITKLRRRIEEIEKLKTDQARHDDGRKESAQGRVRDTICEIFGQNSPQFRRHEHFEIEKGAPYVGASDHEWQQWFMDGIPVAVSTLKGLISDLEEMKEFAARAAPAATPKPSQPSRRVFLVHGHDPAAKEAAARFLMKLDFKPVILHEQPNGGRTLIEKFETYADVAFAVVLLTPDDVGYSKAKPAEMHDRARQNVVFELGFFIGKLGRDKVCALVTGDVEKPSDFHGVAYVTMDAGSGWKMDLARELNAAGLTFDATKLLGA